MTDTNSYFIVLNMMRDAKDAGLTVHASDVCFRITKEGSDDTIVRLRSAEAVLAWIEGYRLGKVEK